MRLSRRPSVLLIAAGLLTIGAIGATAEAAAHPSSQRTIRLYAHFVNDTQLDLGTRGPSPGDQFIVADPLYSSADAKVVGHDRGVCEQTGVDPSKLVCQVTLTLSNGQITIAGNANLTTVHNANAITGGTGAYTSARGTATIDAVSAQKERLTLVIVS
jgi:uncharacterized protein (UPF0371 family)